MKDLVERNLARILQEQVIESFRRLFYKITGMPTSFYFNEWRKKGVDFYPPGKKCEYCKVIQKSPEGLKLCIQDDRIAHERAGKLKKPLIYRCFAGNTCVAVPVIFEGAHICTILSGDILSEEPSMENFQRIKRKLKNLGVDFAALEKAYFKMRVVSRDTVKLATELLSLIVNYIVNRENTILLQEEINHRQKKTEEIKKLRELVRKNGSNKFLQNLSSKPTRNQRIIREAKNFMDRYFMEKIKLEDVAKHMGLGPNYFSYIFKKVCGYTFIDYPIRKRIEKACQLLKDFHMTVTQASMEVGYWDVNYFTQIFKKVTGMPPGKFRDKYKG